MEFVIGLFIALIVIVAAVLLVAFYYLRKGWRFIHRVANGDISEEEFQRMANKYYYKEKNKNDEIKFDKDYFKGNPNGRQQKQQQSTSKRTTRTTDGFTIVDNRRPDQINKKIFAQDEGEYVDYTEA